MYIETRWLAFKLPFHRRTYALERIVPYLSGTFVEVSGHPDGQDLVVLVIRALESLLPVLDRHV